jgi:hypothetical protein
MKSYKIILKETLEKSFLIKADSPEKAMEIVQDRYDNADSDYVLNADNSLVSVECLCKI